VHKISGRRCADGGVPGGSYGRSVYVRNYIAGIDRYLTHLEELHLKLGDRVWPGRTIGTVCDSAVSGKPGSSHVHYGSTQP
jgi:hypothetical protein